MTSIYKKSTVTVNQWYGHSVNVPSIDSPRFNHFATNCLGLAASMIERKTERNLHVALSHSVETAYADPNKSLIVLSSRFVDGYFNAIGTKDRLSGSKTIGAILGILVHEIGHFIYSPTTLKPFHDYIESRTTKQFNRSLAQRIANTLEDIYIEYQIDKSFVNLSWTLTEINKLMLTDEIYNQSILALSSVGSLESEPVKNNILNFLLFAKITEKPGKVSPLVKNIYNLARSVVRMTNLENRCALALVLYDMFAPEKTAPLMNDSSASKSEPEDSTTESEPESEPESTENNTEPTESRDSDAEDTESESSEPEPTESDYNGSDDDDSDDSDDSSESEDSNGSGESEETESSGESTESESELIEEIKKINGFEDSENMPEPIYREIDRDMPIIRSGLDGHKIFESTMKTENIGSVEMDKRFSKLSQVAQQRASINRAFSQQQNRGRNIHQLSRIVSDAKIFADKLPVDAFQPLDVIILLDCSGSMTLRSKLLRASNATLGAAMALLNARCTVQVYGHTSDINREKSVEIYTLLRSGESPAILQKRLNFLNQNHNLCCCNRDGYALVEIAKKFKPSPRKKLIIVISDGAPSGRGSDYDGYYAVMHSQRMVNEIRATGTTVYSLSIDSSAFYTNNTIYGEKNNVCSTDPNAIDSMIRALFDK